MFVGAGDATGAEGVVLVDVVFDELLLLLLSVLGFRFGLATLTVG